MKENDGGLPIGDINGTSLFRDEKGAIHMKTINEKPKNIQTTPDDMLNIVKKQMEKSLNSMQ